MRLGRPFDSVGRGQLLARLIREGYDLNRARRSPVLEAARQTDGSLEPNVLSAARSLYGQAAVATVCADVADPVDVETALAPARFALAAPSWALNPDWRRLFLELAATLGPAASVAALEALAAEARPVQLTLFE